MEELFGLKLGNLTMDAYEKIFLQLLTYANYIKYEKVKIQRFLSGLPTFYKDKIQYDMPKTLKEVIRKEKKLYKLDKNNENKNLKDKKSVTRDQRKKGIEPLVNRNCNFYKHLDSDKIPLVICWNCNENHYARDCPQKKGYNFHNI